MKRLSFLKLAMIIFALVELAVIIFMSFVLKENVIVELALLVGFLAFSLYALFSYDSIIKENSEQIEADLSKSLVDVWSILESGTIVYNDDYEIVFESKLFRDKEMSHIGEKVLMWLPELDKLIKNGTGSEIIIINDDKYRVIKKEGSNTLIFANITKEYDLEVKTQENAYVLGMVNYDNYDEASESEEDVSFINANIKVPVVEYFKKYGIEYKTMRNNRILLILNEKQFGRLVEDRFSILNQVRNVSRKADLLITLSMGFARGSEDLMELDELAQDLLEIAQTRGGDQVVARVVGQEAVFYGGNSEAREKQSKVKVRVSANTLRDLILRSSNVIISGHLMSDADSIGACIGISRLAQSLGKEACIVIKNNSIETMIREAYEKFADELAEIGHHFVSENEAYNQFQKDTLVIMVDHHLAAQSCAKSILKEAGNIVIIDHHRRSADLDIEPTMVYIEAGASSACELVSEFVPYILRRGSLYPVEANFMYLGLIIDTDHFRARTGARTFEAARNLKETGADPLLCERLSYEPYERVVQRSKIINSAKVFMPGILVAKMKDDLYSRAIASQACNAMISTKDINAVFVLCTIGENEVAITARSNGKVNVQTVLEPMNGGGHMTAAGLQRSNCTVDELYEELTGVLNQMFSNEE